MRKRRDKMNLGVFVMQPGHHLAAWRHRDTSLAAATDVASMIGIAKLAERGLLDMLFLADTQGGGIDRSDLRNISLQPFVTEFAKLEPMTLLAALATHTNHIGLVATATTTYFEPYILARQFASLDLISGGRAGWNLVTSAKDAEAANFGRTPHPEPALRYARAKEFALVVKGLWDSWEQGALVGDKASGELFDASKLHLINHNGDYFSVAGPLNAPRSPQGQPVLVQAGSSEAGRELGAETADVIFTAQNAMETAQAFYADMKDRAIRHRREPSQLKIMPGVSVYIGGTDEEAKAKYADLQEMIDPEITRRFLVSEFGRPELFDHPVHEPLPEWLVVKDGASRPTMLLEMARRESLSARQLHLRVAGARGHFTIQGTPETIADQLEDWFDGYAADGFNLMPPLMPGGLADIVEGLVPVLQRRGRFRTSYEGTTLRNQLGLAAPRHPAAWPASSAMSD